MAEFWATVTHHGDAACAICDRWGLHGWKMDPHHFVPKQRLATDAAKVDPRNGVCLCRDCHDDVEALRVECPRPPLLDEFLTDHGLLESGRLDPNREEAA